MPYQTGFGPCMDLVSSLSGNSLKDHTKYLDFHRSANYPSALRNTGELCSTEIPFEDEDPLLIFCKSYQKLAFEAVEVAWTLVLKCYTGNDRVSFRYLIDDENASTQGPGWAGVSIRSVVFQKGDSILDTFRNISSSILPSSSDLNHAGTSDELSGASGVSNSILLVNWHRKDSLPIADQTNGAYNLVRFTTLDLIITN